MIKQKPLSTVCKATQHRCAVAISLALMVAGCAASPFENIAGYDLSSQTQEAPKDYPNVFTEISRSDTLKDPGSRNTTIQDLQAARQSHVQHKQSEIKAASPST